MCSVWQTQRPELEASRTLLGWPVFCVLWLQNMEYASAALANQSEPTNFSLVTDWSVKPSEYNDVEHVLLAIAMAALILAIAFGNLQNIWSFQLFYCVLEYFTADLGNMWVISSAALAPVQVISWWLQPSYGSSDSRRSPTSSSLRLPLLTSSWVWLWFPLARATSCWESGGLGTSCANSGQPQMCCVWQQV